MRGANFILRLTMLVYRELFSRKLMTIWHAILPSGVCLVVFIAFYAGGGLFSDFIYPIWFFRLYENIELYLLLMIPAFFGAVYLGDRPGAWSTMIFPGIVAVLQIAWLRGGLFHEVGWLFFF